MTVFYGVLLLLAALLIVLLVRTASMKPTPALHAEPPRVDPARARSYAEKLSAMVRQETVSSRFDPDRSKFERFQV